MVSRSAAGAPLERPAPAAANPTRRRFDDEVAQVLTSALDRDHIPLTERQFQDQIVDFARRDYLGWKVVHFGGDQQKKAWYDAAGFPDLLMIGPDGQILFREVKSDSGKLTALQTRWSDWLQTRGADYAVWRPSHWPEIVDVLSAGRARVS
jgi:hypothetical protein